MKFGLNLEEEELAFVHLAMTNELADTEMKLKAIREMVLPAGNDQMKEAHRQNIIFHHEQKIAIINNIIDKIRNPIRKEG